MAKKLNENQKVRTKAALQHLELKEKHNNRIRPHLISKKYSYDLTTGPMFGFIDNSSDMKVKSLLFGLPIDEAKERKTLKKVRKAEQKNCDYDIVLLSNVKKNKVNMFVTLDDLKKYFINHDLTSDLEMPNSNETHTP